MKIIHIELVGPFNENMSYQGAILPLYNKKAGHDVTVISSCYAWNDKGKIIRVPENDIIKNGIRYIRINYDYMFLPFFAEKIRKSKKLLKYIENIKPDIILNHDLQTFELFTLQKYKTKNVELKLYADSHTDINNSARSWLSKNFLHKLFYRYIIKNNIQIFEKIFYVSYETKDFLINTYEVSEEKMEFYPLGGEILSNELKDKIRKEKRTELGFSEDNIVFCHSGKMDYEKRTYELLQNFSKVKNSNFRLIIIGVFSKETEEKNMELINSDERIVYLGWKESNELIKYIAASDLYVQPGSQSATMQSALCVGTPVLFKNIKSHKAYMHGNAFAINDCNEMIKVFEQISEKPEILHYMSEKAYEIAKEILDYSKLAERITL